MTTSTNMQPNLDRLTVLLVTYQSEHCAPPMGRALAQFPHIVVIDNGSTDGTVTAFRRELPQAKIIENGKNLGFGAANNRGAQAAQTEFILLLNPDCIIDPFAASAMVECADQYLDASAIAPQLIDRHGSEDKSYSLGTKSWPGKGPAAEADICVRFASGACMLIRQQAMQQVKGFDEDFFLYYEDTDLCLRLTAQSGAIVVNPKAKVTHLSRGSSGGSKRYKAEYLRGYHHIQSKFLFELKHHQLNVSLPRRIRYSVIAGLEAIVRLCVLDFARSARVFGRVVGALRYTQDMLARKVKSESLP